MRAQKNEIMLKELKKRSRKSYKKETTTKKKKKKKKKQQKTKKQKTNKQTNVSLEKELAESQSKLTELTNDYVGGVFGDSEDENMQK